MGSQLLPFTLPLPITTTTTTTPSSVALVSIKSPPHIPRTLSQSTHITSHVYKHPAAILLELCTSITELHQILPLVIKSGLYNVYLIQTKLVSLFCNYNSMAKADRVFEPVKDKIDPLYYTMLKGYAKNSTLDTAISFFCRMKYDSVKPVMYNFTYLLKVCGDKCELSRGKEIHGQLVTNGFSNNVFAMTGVVNMYAKCGQIDDAFKMFDRMPVRDLVSWNTIISGYAQNGLPKVALESIIRMHEDGKRPDPVTIVSTLPAVADMGLLRIGKSVHGYVIRAGFDSLVNISTAFVDMYSKCGMVGTARLIFDGMNHRTVVSWNSMIHGYVQNDDPEEAMAMFQRMLDEEVEPTNVTIMKALQACADLGDIQRGLFVHRLLDQVSWNAMILGFAHNGCVNEALYHFGQMRLQSIEPDSFTMVSVILALANFAVMRQARWIHGLVIKTCWGTDVFVMTALVDMYAKCGAVDTARELFNMMDKRHVTTWNAMIDGYGTHGLGKDAVELFNEMLAGTIQPNHITFLCVVSACSHSGLVEEGLRYFTSMKKEYGLEPAMDHYGSMVDLLGRAGRLTEACDFIQKMPIEPEITVYGALLGACKIHKNVEIGEKAANKLFELSPDEGGYHVLLSNIYATASLWDKVAKVRTMVEKQGLKKTPGCSLVELRNEVHSFYSGSTSHPQSKMIYAFLEELVHEIKAAGYVPETNSIHDVEDDVKEQLLNSHSEKLAIAFGLLNTSPGTTIHIRKNLRVCCDCHNATKYISLVTGRAIVVRDMHRFHHFKDGTCSCGDYW
ncbi:PPR domain-containing protein/PPR_2 domain-containing protein/DYW_deaminase domain-containing protein [Cephalotus follicularis]|uniref:PPR domain-containing protein/PPR_2 domain-containing protein/DYW_deaminase domain-containing protein n=1 Tax=Cephalotus follicularis TaxID=3775 RepID=A0A1Q3D7X2_CEPFO|nr:PPR domain-containing protein/PPR_2 domain-containing protein/DYW_deaminase domain-containing protein [Cephalotus follicularis]